MKKYRFAIVLVIVLSLVACVKPPMPTQTETPLATPTIVSPLPTPDEGSIVERPIQKMEGNIMNAELLASVAGIVLSLSFSYIPGIKGRFEELESNVKQAVMGGLLLGVALAVFGLSCGEIVDIGITCDKAGALGLLNVLVSALIANQSIYLITKR
ncbi:MAG: hypothetical protein KAT00_01340 [Planctomycetes bacterium]|nr:hypothetical protein [Planctomycetota bacterium]